MAEADGGGRGAPAGAGGRGAPAARVAVSAAPAAGADWLGRFGLDDGWRRAYAAAQVPLAQAARLVGELRGALVVVAADGPCELLPTGTLRHAIRSGGSLAPVVGDWVVLSARPPRRLVAVLPRRTSIARKQAGKAQRQQVLASNVDLALLVCAVGEANVARLERLVAVARGGGVEVLLLLNKVDLLPPDDDTVAQLGVALPGVEICGLSARDAGPLPAAVQARLRPGATVVLLGSSGVGKTTLYNRLGAPTARTQVLGTDGKGQHTTTTRAIAPLPGGALVMDTPGLREVGTWQAEAGVDAAFADIVALAQRCHFASCGHGGEPGCAVEAAIEAGELSAARLERWQTLREESRGTVLLRPRRGPSSRR